ncbi:hypothetical protein [Rhizobium sp. 18065]|uniref:ribonuclease toxin HepT-like protein n=1 Tax=Rhizobium sp. 18065 TaxID=2681411 RepID=UPI001FCEB2E7|nr:hypothetical protein [Rhizobium sp. 18065]
MTSFSLPAFSRLTPKILRAERELAQMQQFYEKHSAEVAAGDWGAMSAVSSGIHNVYNGVENILLSLARDVDDDVPTGPSAHQDVLDQMAADVAGMRPALLDLELYEALTELKGFRHLVRHRYGLELKPDKVVENLALLQKAFPSFLAAVIALEQTMSDSEDHDGASGASGEPTR